MIGVLTIGLLLPSGGSAMSWSESDQAAIVESFQKYGIARCPQDSALLQAQRICHKTGYLLIARCPICNRRLQKDVSQDTVAAERRD